MDTFLRQLTALFHEAGQALYLVGGSVRDELLGRPSHDIDLTTPAPTSTIKSLLEASSAGAVYAIGEKFGTIGAVAGDYTVEVTTFRNRDEAPAGGGPIAALYTDLAHRDFTVNAMARDLDSGELHDPFDGATDLRHHLIRGVGEPQDRFREDPVRMLRAVRLAAELGFFLDRETRDAIRELAPSLQQVAQERTGDEMDRLLVTERPGDAIDMLDSLGLLQYIVPEMLEMHTMERGQIHFKEVFPHTLKVVDRTAPDLVLRWAALLHDVAKPATFGIADGEVHFHGHEKVGARMAREILTRLRRPEDVTEPVVRLVDAHLRIGQYEPSWTDGAVRRFLRETHPITDLLFALSRADITSQRAQRVAAALARVDALYERCERIRAEEEVEKITSPLDGNELMAAFGGQPGPWIGRVKNYLLDLVLDGALAPDDKAGAERLARDFLGGQSGEATGR